MRTSTDPYQTRETADAPRRGESPRRRGAVGGDESSPVFVDSSGKRRKGWRRMTIIVVGILCGYTVLLGISFAGGPIPPAALLPVPGVPDGHAPADPAVTPATDGTAPTRTPSSHDTAAGQAAVRTTAAGAAGARTGAPSTAPQPTTASSALPQPSTTAASVPVTHGHPTTPPSHSHSKTP